MAWGKKSCRKLVSSSRGVLREERGLFGFTEANERRKTTACPARPDRKIAKAGGTARQPAIRNNSSKIAAC